MADVWQSKTVLPAHGLGDPGRYATANGDCAIGTKIYVLGGLNQTPAQVDKLDIYDTVADSWSSGAVYPPGAVSWAAAAGLGGYLYVAGGQIGGSSVFTTTRRYDPAGDSWSSLANMPSERFAACGVSDGTYFYVVGGSDGFGAAQSSLFRYNTGANSWATMTAMPAAKESPAACYLDGYLYVVGGSGSNTFYRYDIAGDSWTTLTAIPAPTRQGAFIGAIDGKVFVVNGDSTNPSDASTHEWDVAGASWTSRTAPSQGRRFGSYGTVDQHLYVIGGFYTTGDYRDENERYVLYDLGGGLVVGYMTLN